MSLPGSEHNSGLEEALAPLGDMRGPFLAAVDEIQERVVAGGIDLVILCARRLPCLYQILLDRDHSGIEGALVVSDRFLDVACDWRWSKVLIVDDTMVLGSTLSSKYDEVVRRVRDIDPDGKVTTYVVCLDSERCAGVLRKHIDCGCQVEKNTDEVEAFSRNIVTTLFRNQRPFFSDFPITGARDLDDTTYTQFVTGEDWSVADVTSPLVALDKQRAFVQLPTDAYRRELLSRLPEPVHALVDTFKLRSWVTRVDDDYIKVTFVPLALIGGAAEADLDLALSALGKASNAPEWEKLHFARLGGEAKHRLLQMFTSVYLLAVALPPSIAKVLSDDKSWVDMKCMDLYFGTQSETAAVLFDRLVAAARRPPAEVHREVDSRIQQPRRSELLQDDDLSRLLWASRDLLATTVEGDRFFERPGAGDVTKIGVIASHAVNALFGYIGEHLEVGQQKDIREFDDDDYDLYVKEYVDKPGARVLRQALTMNELAEALIGDPGAVSRWSRDAVSLGVDIGNDLGIVVPITLTDGRGIVYRAYRLGETAPLAKHPLVKWSPAEGAQGLDDFSKTVTMGEPALSSTIPFALPGLSSRATQPDAGNSELAVLLRMHEQAFPGKPSYLFDGIVTSKAEDDQGFEALLTSSPQGVQSSAKFGIHQVRDIEVGLVTVGAEFRWTVFERSHGAGKDRTSRIRFARPNLIPDNAAESAERRFGWLTEYENGATATTVDADTDAGGRA